VAVTVAVAFMQHDSLASNKLLQAPHATTNGNKVISS